MFFIVLCVCHARTAFGTTVQKLLQQYNGKQYSAVLKSLKSGNYPNRDTVRRQYLLYKTLLNLDDFSRSAAVLQRLEKGVDWALEPIILNAKVDLHLEKGDKDGLLKLLIRSTDKLDNSFINGRVTQVLAEFYTDYGNKPLYRKCIETLWSVVDSIQKDPKVLGLYLNSLERDDPKRKDIIARIWGNTDVTKFPASLFKEIDPIEKNAARYSDIIRDHFEKQYQLKNLSYLAAEIPVYLPYLKDKKEVLSRLRQLYFRTLIRKKQYTILIGLLKSEEGRQSLDMSAGDALSKQFYLCLKKGRVDQALDSLNQLMKMDPNVDVRGRYLAIGNFYYERGKYRKSLAFFDKVDRTDLSKATESQMQWKLLRIHHRLGHIKKLKNIADWALQFDFESKEVAAKFCYWGFKLKLYTHGDSLSCYQQYPFTYYGFRAFQANPYKPELEKSVFEHPKDFPKGSISPKEKELLQFLTLLYVIGETDMADLIIRRYLNNHNNMTFFLETVDVLYRAERYYLLQFLVDYYYGKQIRANNNSYSQFLLPVFYPAAYRAQVNKFIEKTNVSPMLVFAVMREESNFRPDVESNAGAIGLMQLMPRTAKYIGRKIRVKVDDSRLNEPDLNMRLGIAFLKRLMRRYKGNLYYTLAAYNGGPTNVKRWRKKVQLKDDDLFVEAISFDETRDYVKRVLRSYYIYQKIYGQTI
ncbi:MAG: lytic transglycosylase domain-containing protein [Proteobacteria bacterium]|nr:lytic transglycosylase domain-containing protein [Pseudomonadota bacterium]